MNKPQNIPAIEQPIVEPKGLKVSEIISAHTQESLRVIKAYGNLLGAMGRIENLLNQLQQLSSWLDVYVVRINPSYWQDETDAEVFIRLKEGITSSIVRDLVRVTSEKATKQKEWDEESLRAELTFERIRYTINNYIPETCRIEEKEVIRKVSFDGTVCSYCNLTYDEQIDREECVHNTEYSDMKHNWVHKSKKKVIICQDETGKVTEKNA